MDCYEMPNLLYLKYLGISDRHCADHPLQT